MKRRQQLSLGILAAVLIFFWAGARQTGFAAGEVPTDQPATHNMLVFGEETVYLSHLPMFQEEGRPVMPHRYQAILEVTFAKQEEYVKDLRKSPAATFYTLNPERFVLPQLVASDAQHQPLRSFRAERIIRGHLEREGSVPILQKVDVRVQRVIRLREFDPRADKPAQLEYLLFGKGQEFWLAHQIVGPPDFDQVLSVKFSGHPLTDAELEKGVPVVFPGTRNSPADRLRANQRITGQIAVGNPAVLQDLVLEVVRERYFEEGELRVPALFESTPEEGRAGFP